MNNQSTILIVDDQVVMRDTIALLLAKENYHLVFAEDGRKALVLAEKVTPDIVLLDIMMPGMDGFEVCRRLRADPKMATVPIIMVTALNDRHSWVTGIEAGADEFVFKPFDTVELRTRVRNIIQLNRYRRLLAERMKADWVIENTDDGYLMLDAAGQIQYANPQARLFLDLPGREPEHIKQNFMGLVQRRYHLEPRDAWEGWPDSAEDNAPRYLVRPETSTAHAFWLLVEHLKLPAGVDTAQIVRLRDVSEKMNLQQEVWRFNYMIFHKLRTPLTVMLSSLELLARHGEKMSPDKLQELSQRALAGGERLRNEVDDILQFMRRPTLPAPGQGFLMTELGELVEETRQELQIKTLQMAGLDSITAVRVPLSRRSMRMIVWEILENSLKFHPQKLPTVQVFASRLKSGEVGIWIGDDGQTLSPEHLAQVWLPYFQGEKTFTGEIKGMGVGLPMVASLLWRVGGRCRIYNRQDAPGVVVELILPVAAD